MTKQRWKFGWREVWRHRPLWCPTVLLIAVVLSAAASSASVVLATARPDATDPLNRPSGEDIYVPGPGTRPRLVFACCDRGIPDLLALSTNSVLLADLKTLHAGLAVALSELSLARAQAVHRFNENGIPSVAWLLLPPEEGYYVNASNEPQAAAQFAKFEKWTRENDLHWAAVGLDIEPNFEEFRWPKLRLAWTLLRRAFDGERVQSSRRAYSELIHEMQAAGYSVQTYQLMFLADERRAHSTILERLFGLVDVRSDEEVLMTYSSFNHPAGAAMVWSYGHDTQTLAVGTTLGSGDAKTDAKFGPLNWDEFSRDVTVASHFSQTVGVYNLEGCIRQGFLPRLITMDWNQVVTVPAAALARVRKFRQRVQAVLWAASHAVYFVAIFLIGIAWLIRLRVRARKTHP